MAYYVGIDGGGTRTTLAVADAEGRELIRRTGPAGLVDPRRPAATAELLVGLIRETAAAAGQEGPATGLCAGLAGVGNVTEREIVQDSLLRSGVAEQVLVVSDGETALHGALGGGPGILLIAGTGSVAYGRSEDGRVARCGGWGMIVGDEGAGYRVGQEGLRAALLSADGRGMNTRLLPVLLHTLGLAVPEAIPPWVARAEKSEVALLAVQVLRLSEQGDPVAREIVSEAALDLGAHVEALVDRLGPWSKPPAVVLHGGLAQDPLFAPHLIRVLRGSPTALRITESKRDAVGGAIELARSIDSAAQPGAGPAEKPFASS